MDMTVSTEIQAAAAQATSNLLSQQHGSVRLGSLYLDKRNVRKIKGKMPIPDLAAAILREGLLQNLVVVARKGKKKGQTHEVIAGGRRYQALSLLEERGDITLEFAVQVTIVEADHATAASLIENVAREAMHPADELDAFAALLKQGQTFDTIGNSFGVSAMTVRRRIKLLSVSPKLVALLRTDEITLEQLGALAATDSHEAQEAVWEETQHNKWMREPERLRSRLTQEEIDANESPVARFVGLQAYEAAGGQVRRDLFSEDDTGYICDSELLYRLADEKLAAAGQSVRDDGWSWVETRHERQYGDFARYGRLDAEVIITDEMRPKIEALGEKIKALTIEIDAFYEQDDSTDEECERNDEREEESAKLEREKEELEEACAQWTAHQKAIAGVVVSISRAGELQKEFGLVEPGSRPVDDETGVAMEVRDQYGREMKPKTRAAHSDKMVARLTAHRTIAVQAEILKRPDVALAFLTSRLAGDMFYNVYSSSLQVRSTQVHHQLTNAADDMEQSADWNAIVAAKEAWHAKLPEKFNELLPWLLQQSADEVTELMAFCVARSIDGLRNTEGQHAPMDAISEVLGVDMADHWQATESSYFGHISKKQMMAAVTEAVSAEAAAPLATMKKDAAAQAAEKALSGVRWVPEPMRARVTADHIEDDEVMTEGDE